LSTYRFKGVLTNMLFRMHYINFILRTAFFTLLLWALNFSLSAQPIKKTTSLKKVLQADRIDTHIKIDGKLDEEAWDNALIAKDFYQYEPYNGSLPSEQTEVRVLFDNQAIYIGVMLYDNEPMRIYHELGKRDNSDKLKADVFSLLISPYNDGINYSEFVVSASGVQTDIMHTGIISDRSWNAVWQSSVAITDKGWIVELKIPYSALRFSKKIEGNWGINFRRLIKRKNEWSSWNPIDNSVSGIVNQSGELAGIKYINSPIRLSFSPYISGYIYKHPDNETLTKQFNGGMDVQFGISESFTLDMTLIPDFGQVKSDDKVLNISPYEVQYGEMRPFFNEGMDLFAKGGIFYSRRIGTRPKGYDSVYSNLQQNEQVIANPQETSLLNATKVSGRTSSGLGIGFLNAITLNTYATIKDTITHHHRKSLTQGTANYNMVVFDQTLRNNSYVSLANTNLVIPNSKYMANVSATDFMLLDKTNMYALYGKAALSQISDEKLDVGYKYNLGFNKMSGNVLFDIWTNTESKTYNPNDMGYLQMANEFSNGVEIGYRVYKPFWRLLNWSSSLSGQFSMLHNPMVYSTSRISANFRTIFAKSYFFILGEAWLDPHETNDYHEPRVGERMVIRPRRMGFNFKTSSDYRKPIALDTEISYWKAVSMGTDNLSFRISPRFRLSNRLFIIYEATQEFDKNDIGYIAHSNDESIVFMGLRDVSTLTNTVEGLLSFNANAFVNLRVRHYWRWVSYSIYHTLNTDGSLSTPIFEPVYNKDINFNLFNIDLTYQWNFAPGSELSIVWKNVIEVSDGNVRGQYFSNFSNLLSAKQGNSLSLRMLYYLDYNSIAKKRRI